MNSRGPLWRSLRSVLHTLRHGRRIAAQRKTLGAFAEQGKGRIVIGSSGTAPDGWVATDREVVDLLREDTWLRYFAPGSLDAILAEHVWEHLPAEVAGRCAGTCFRFLKPGGYLRVAVPDGLHPDASYIDQVRPGGSGPGADDHKVLYTYASFRDLFSREGFEVRLYEYYDESGRFQYQEWNPQGGLIRRSMRFDERNSPGRPAYTSIVLDAVRPKGARVAEPGQSTRM
jgi:predicted SAM-dependent methyltransferase